MVVGLVKSVTEFQKSFTQAKQKKITKLNTE